MNLSPKEVRLLNALKRPSTRGELLEAMGMKTHVELNPLIDSLENKGLTVWWMGGGHQMWGLTPAGSETLDQLKSDDRPTAAARPYFLAWLQLGPK